MGKLVLGNVDDDQANLKLRNVLLELHFAIDGQQDVKFLLGECQHLFEQAQTGDRLQGCPKR
ncbi:hypothetical protein SBA4_1380013 [Candidatus Sulfopaludibacter sp. SbA4]|nr:hypothetical protein SBA4_1380013 [Candidatus Sulfopaludibacter sp. SbA4]